MFHIGIISASVRKERRSHRVALYLANYIKQHELAEVDLIDLNDFKFPVFTERLKYLSDVPAQVVNFASRIKAADGIIIVSPEYNGGYPASLKNAIDLLYEDWKRKPIAISTVSDGAFGGSQVLTSLQFVLWKMKALTVPALFPVPLVHETFDDKGVPMDAVKTDKRASLFLDELFWCIRACEAMK